MSLALTSASADETAALGLDIGKALDGPLLILLRGDYGTGKTTFVQGLADGLGCCELPRSPSYLLVRVHEEGRLPLIHADLYRVHSEAEVEELALEELAGPNGVIAVEWPGEQRWLEESGRPWLGLDFSCDLDEDHNNTDQQRHIFVSWSPDLPPAIIAALHAARHR